MNAVQFHLHDKTRTSTNPNGSFFTGIKFLSTIILVPTIFSNTTRAPTLYSYFWKTLYYVMNTDLWNRAMNQAVIRWSLTLNAPVRSQATPCGNCCGHSVNGEEFTPSTSVFPCHYRCSNYAHSFAHDHRSYMSSEIESIINKTLINYITNVIYAWSINIQYCTASNYTANH